MLSLVDEDASAWRTAKLLAPELTCHPATSLQIQAALRKQANCLAHIRAGEPRTSYVLPFEACGGKLQGCWAKCTIKGSRCVALTCQPDEHCKEVFTAIVDMEAATVTQ